MENALRARNASSLSRVVSASHASFLRARRPGWCKAAPETHKGIFENEHVRLLDVTIPPHSKEPVHTHCLASTLYMQQIGDIIVGDLDGKITFDSRQMKENEKQKATFVLWNAGERPHWDENPDDVPINIISD